MPGGMPYQLEKGPVLRLIEQHLNRPRAEMRAMLQVLRDSEAAETANPGRHNVDWVDAVIPGLWANPAFARRPAGQPPTQDHIKRHWFGYEKVDGLWVRQDTPDTGFWQGYRGDVDRIVRGACRWALELALGIPRNGSGPGRSHPWQIELFWKCVAPWFETWVVHRPVANTGLVSLFFITPSHQGANLAESPIASAPTTMVAGAHPAPSAESDYEIAVGAQPGDPQPTHAVAAIDRQYATWVVTHRNHQTTETVTTPNLSSTNNVGPTNFQDWGIPAFCRYEGLGEIVIVSPSMPAGGVKHDGSV